MGDVSDTHDSPVSPRPGGRARNVAVLGAAVVVAAALIAAGIVIGSGLGADDAGGPGVLPSPLSTDPPVTSAPLTQSGASTTSAASSTAVPQTAIAPTATTSTVSAAETTSTTTLPAITAAPTTSTTAPVTPVPPTTVQRSATDGQELPPIPSEVEGYTPYLDVQSDQTRVFKSQGLSTPLTFRGQMNSCADAFWVARWRSLNPDVTVQGGRGPYDADITEYELETSLMPPAATSGYLSGFICERPVFFFGDALNGNQANLVDVVVEWQYFDASAQSLPPTPASPPGSPPPAPAPACSEYTFVFDFPFARCARGPAVSYIQFELSDRGYPVIEDGFFGQATDAAVRSFQAESGLAVDGIVGDATWRALVGNGLGPPGVDSDGDGTITPDEMYLD